ncbi:hypothetical protein HYH02_010304 [Chlamydomonas schloesseri]|uniref:Peptidase M11 gametolysin domain-containing protein n=1 Tax=Chlamydomonas schloesseri TaxID=2026947 RepID=A0A835TAD1_9CHLO|nr:hypothetical protein HYH02_010304 [Chlamydomonas schloesseri]|eukprot:KAG2440416.1 hypothetical protein HYH02_010304 [Chlamydomonas schloesseri]
MFALCWNTSLTPPVFPALCSTWRLASSLCADDSDIAGAASDLCGGIRAAFGDDAGYQACLQPYAGIRSTRAVLSDTLQACEELAGDLLAGCAACASAARCPNPLAAYADGCIDMDVAPPPPAPFPPSMPLQPPAVDDAGSQAPLVDPDSGSPLPLPAGPSSPPPWPPGTNRTTLFGRLDYVSSGNDGPYYVLVQLTGETVLRETGAVFVVGSETPDLLAMLRGAGGASAGAVVKVTCQLHHQERRCLAVWGVALSGEKSGGGTMASSAPGQVVSGSEVALAVITRITACDAKAVRDLVPRITAEDARALYEDYNSFFRSCSYGAYGIDLANLTITLASLRCEAQLCASSSTALMRAAQSAINRTLYDGAYTRSYLLPDKMDEVLGCQWNGMSVQTSRQVFLRLATPPLWLAMHEWLHLYGLKHAGIASRLLEVTPPNDERDLTSAMGMACGAACTDGISVNRVCPNAPQVYYLGWATFLPDGDLNSTSMVPGRRLKFTLPAQYVSSSCLIRIRPDWLGVNYTHNVYLSFRVAAGGDADLSVVDGGNYNGKVLVHQIDKANDVRYAGDLFISTHGQTQLVPDQAFSAAAAAVKDITAIKVSARAISVTTTVDDQGEGGGGELLTSVDLVLCRYLTSRLQECGIESPPPPAPPLRPRAPNPPPPPRPPRPPPPPLQRSFTGLLAWLPGTYRAGSHRLDSVAEQWYVLELNRTAHPLRPATGMLRYLRLEGISLRDAVEASGALAAGSGSMLSLLRSRVSLWCDMDPTGRICTVRPGGFVLLDPESRHRRAEMLQAVSAVGGGGSSGGGGTRKLQLVALAVQPRPSCNIPAFELPNGIDLTGRLRGVTDTAADADGGGAVAPPPGILDAVAACSGGAMQIELTNMLPAEISIDCADTAFRGLASAFRSCDAERLAEAAEYFLGMSASPLSGMDVLWLYVLPRILGGSTCNWVGRAHMGGNSMWLLAGDQGLSSDTVLLKALMMPFGMRPASLGYVGSGDSDPTTPLGSATSGRTCLSAPEAARLGWLSQTAAAARVMRLSDAGLPVGQAVHVQLVPYGAAASADTRVPADAVRALRIDPASWLQQQDPALDLATANVLYLSYRVQLQPAVASSRIADTLLSGAYNGTVTVHQTGRDEDISTDSWEDGESVLLPQAVLLAPLTAVESGGGGEGSRGRGSGRRQGDVVLSDYRLVLRARELLSDDAVPLVEVEPATSPTAIPATLALPAEAPSSPSKPSATGTAIACL